MRLTGASLMDYWTYQNNYPIVQPDGKRPYPVFSVIRQIEQVLTPQSKVAVALPGSEDLHLLATAGPRPGQFAILLINSAGAGTVTLSGLPPELAVSIEQNTASAQEKRSSSTTDVAGHLAITVPARSVVSVLGGPGSR